MGSLPLRIAGGTGHYWRHRQATGEHMQYEQRDNIAILTFQGR